MEAGTTGGSVAVELHHGWSGSDASAWSPAGSAPGPGLQRPWVWPARPATEPVRGRPRLEPRDPPPLPLGRRPWPLLFTSAPRSHSPAASPPSPGSISLSTRGRSWLSRARTAPARPACCVRVLGFCPSPPAKRSSSGSTSRRTTPRCAATSGSWDMPRLSTTTSARQKTSGSPCAPSASRPRAPTTRSSGSV